jgi:tRNA A22 N-methylase
LSLTGYNLVENTFDRIYTIIPGNNYRDQCKQGSLYTRYGLLLMAEKEKEVQERYKEELTRYRKQVANKNKNEEKKKAA